MGERKGCHQQGPFSDRKSRRMIALSFSETLWNVLAS
jgi:hypothetical protein